MGARGSLKEFMFWIYAIALAYCSFVFSLNMDDWAREPKELFLLAILAFFIAYKVWEKNRFIAGFIVWVLFGMWWNDNLLIHACAVTKGMSPIFDLWVNSIAFYIVGIGILYLLVQTLNIKKLCYFICLGAFCQSLFGLYQFFTGYLCVGTIGNLGLFNEFMAICLPLFLFIDNKYMRYIGMGVLFFAMMVCKPIQSHDIGIGTLALIPGGLFFIWHKKRSLLKYIIPAIIVISIVIMSSSFKVSIVDSGKARLNFWKDSIHYGLKGNPVTGWGLGNYKQVMTRVQTSPATVSEGKLWEAHNEYIQAWFETGIVGLLLILAFIGNIIRRFYCSFNIIEHEMPLITSLVIILAISCLSFPFHVASTALISVTIIFMLDRREKCR